jgi:hypothetical protein
MKPETKAQRKAKLDASDRVIDELHYTYDDTHANPDDFDSYDTEI